MSFFFEHWEPITGVSIAFIGLLYSIRGFELRRIKAKAGKDKFYRNLEIEIANLKKDKEALSNRIDKLSTLCENLINSNKEASVKAEAAYEKADTMLTMLKKKE